MAKNASTNSNFLKVDLSQSYGDKKSSISVNNSLEQDKKNGTERGNEGVFQKKIDTKLLVCLTFFVVAASPVGIEPVVAAGGPLLGILGLIIFPFIYSVPMAIMSSEMASIYPQAGGSVQWTQNINHHFGALNSYLHIIYNWVDNSLYPVIIVDYLSYFVPQMMEPGWRFLAGVIIFSLVALLNCFGISVVGKAAIVFTVIILVPFLIFAGLACTEFDAGKWNQVPKEIDWVLYISTLFWNMCGYDRISDTAEEVKNPTKTFPKALFITVAIVTLTYLLPVAFGVMIDPNYSNWEDGHFVDMATMIPILNGSNWLAIIIMLTGALSQFGLLLAAVSCCSRELYSMAEYRHIPGRKYVMKISKKTNEPWIAIIIQSVISCPLVVFDFEFLMVLDGVFYGYVLIIEYIAFFYSRFSKVGKQQRQERILEVVSKELENERINEIHSSTDRDNSNNVDERTQNESNIRSSDDYICNIMENNQENEQKNDNNEEEDNDVQNTDIDENDLIKAKFSENQVGVASDKTSVLSSEWIMRSDGDTKEELLGSVVESGKSYKELAKEHMFLMPCGIFGVVIISITPLILCLLVIIGNGLLTNVLVLTAIAIMYCYYFFSYNYRLKKYGRERMDIIDEIEDQNTTSMRGNNSSSLDNQEELIIHQKSETGMTA